MFLCIVNIAKVRKIFNTNSFFENFFYTFLRPCFESVKKQEVLPKGAPLIMR